MKPEITMSDFKKSDPDTPVVITQVTTTPEERKRKTKRYLIIGGSAVLVVAIVLAAILVGMYLFTKAQTDLIQYTLNVDKDTKADVTVDQDDNSVEFHSYNDNYEAWTVNDFNRDIQTLKVKTPSGTNCYIGPLNRTSVMDPSQIKSVPSLPSGSNETYTSKLYYDISAVPVTDTSFLGKKARDACMGTSVYWVYPRCGVRDGIQRKKRTTCHYNCYYAGSSGGYDVYNCYLNYCS